MPTLTRILVPICIGVAAILAWQSYGDAARRIIASSSPQLDWLAPQTTPIAYSDHDTIGLAAQAAASLDQHRLNAVSLDLDAIRQSVDRIAITQEQITRNIDQLTARQERMTRNVDQLAAGQERMTREINKLQAVEQQTKPRPALARNSVPRSAPAPMVR
jgi:methyl-accepting chemotaxis protein